MKDVGLDKGLVINFDTNKNSGIKQFFSFRKLFWKMLKAMHVPFADDCCDAASSEFSPVRFNTSTSKVQYYNSTTNAWTDVPTASLNPA